MTKTPTTTATNEDQPEAPIIWQLPTRVYAYKGADRRGGQVRCKVPLSGTVSTTNATIARVLVNAKQKQQARTLDGNPLNLRRENLYLLGNPYGIEGKAGNAKTDTLRQLAEQSLLRRMLAGAGYGHNNHQTESGRNNHDDGKNGRRTQSQDGYGHPCADNLQQ